MRHLYDVVPFYTGIFSGTLNESKLKAILNDHGQKGWKLERTVSERRRVLFFFSREVHFLVFRFVGDDKGEELLRQLIRLYGHEPSV